MSLDSTLLFLLDGLASASSLFLVAAGLSLIFGVTRIVNFAHGSFYMLGAYFAFSLTSRLGLGLVGFWGATVLAALAVAVFGTLMEMLLLRRIYRAPELYQLLATFGVVLIVEQMVLIVWGPEDLFGPRAAGLEGSIEIVGRSFPEYRLFLMLLGPAVLLALSWTLRHTRWGILVRAATEDREMLGALGVNQSWLFTSVFFVGAFLAGLGGALQLPLGEPANHTMDLRIIVDAFVVVVVGGMGSIPGAFLASVLIGVLNTLGIWVLPQFTFVLVFLIMAIVLIVRPWGLAGRREAMDQPPVSSRTSFRPSQKLLIRGAIIAAAFLLLLPWWVGDYGTLVATEIVILMCFAASLGFLLSIGGMVSFGHAAYFGLGAYGAALSVKHWSMPMEGALVMAPALALAGALVFGWFSVRLRGVYFAMLTLAFAQITWAIAFQWYEVTGGDNGIPGVWPSPWASQPAAFYYLTLALVAPVLFLLLGRISLAPFGCALRAVRDAPVRAESIGINPHRQQWLAFVLAGTAAGVAGGLFAFLKGNVDATVLSVPTSIDALVMVLLGGVETLIGPFVGAAFYRALEIYVSRVTDLWPLVLGSAILVIVLAFPEGIVGAVLSKTRGGRRNGAPRSHLAA